MELSLRKRRKITLLFLLGVGIPSLVLGYLAFRGIRNELALTEQRLSGEHRTLARQVNDTVAAEILAAELIVARTITGQDLDASLDFRRTLSDLKDVLPLIDEVFYLDNIGTVSLPAADLLYLSDGSEVTRTSPTWPSTAAAYLQSGQQFEFRERRYGEAQSRYRSALATVSDPVLEGEALFAIARVQRKAGQPEAALTSCSTLIDDYGDIRTTAGMPMGPVALLERGSLLLATGGTAAALDAYVALLEGMVAGAWVMERAQFSLFAGQAVDSVENVLARSPAGISLGPYRSSVANFEAREVERREKTERLLLFQETAAEDLGVRLLTHSDGVATTGRRFALEIGGYTYLVSGLDRELGAEGAWGLLLDSDALSDFVRRAVERSLDPSTSDWAVKGRDGRALVERDDPPEGPITINATFADNFPPWLIEFHQSPQSPYRRLFASSQSIFFYMFLLIASILAFGLVLTVRAVTHELELARLKSDFVSTVSHEFKSPLTSIRHMAEMLQAGSVPTEERRSRYYDVLVEQSARLSSLVTNILDLARLEEGKKEFQFEITDIGALVRDLVSMTQQRVGHEGWVVEAHVEEPLPSVSADGTAITQAISNLVENALQYSRGKKQVNVSVSAGDGCLYVAVADSGVGIPANEIDKVFDRFYRGSDPLTRTVKGSGLGLTLVKEIVEAHHGAVSVESEPGRGSTFTIKLPAKTEQENAEDPDS